MNKLADTSAKVKAKTPGKYFIVISSLTQYYCILYNNFKLGSILKLQHFGGMLHCFYIYNYVEKSWIRPYFRQEIVNVANYVIFMSLSQTLK